MARRYGNYGELDTTPQDDGDSRFTGLDMKRSPGIVKQGYVSEAKNVRCQDGVYTSRGGHAGLNWTSTTGSNLVSNGTFETLDAGANVFTNWTGTSFVSAESSDVYAGVYSCKLDNAGTIAQTTSATSTERVYLRFWAKTTDDSKFTQINISTTGGTQAITLTETWTQYNIYNLFTNGIISFTCTGITGAVALLDNVEVYIESSAVGTIYGSENYSDQNGNSKVFVAGASSGHIMGDGGRSDIAYPSGETVSKDVEIVQAFDKVMIFRGVDNHLVWDSINDTSFEILSKPATVDGFLDIPDTNIGVYFKNRLWLVDGKDAVMASDLLSNSNYRVANRFYVNQGSNDEIIALTPYGDDDLIVWKRRSIYVLRNCTGDLSDVELDLVSDEVGLNAKKSVVTIGQVALFLSDQGVFTLEIYRENRLLAGEIPFSEPIEPLIDRISWGSSSKASAAFWDGRYYLAVPLDDATENDHVLVYNFTNKAWEGYDTHGDSSFNVKDFLQATASNKVALVAVSNDDFIYLYDYDEECYDRDYAVGGGAVESFVTTRGYPARRMQRNKSFYVSTDINVWGSTITITMIGDGKETAVSLLSSKTFSDTTYLTKGTTAWVNTNTNNDFENDNRDDYKVDVGVITTSTSGFNAWRKRPFRKKFRARGRGAFSQVKVLNNTGYFELRGVALESKQTRRSLIGV